MPEATSVDVTAWGERSHPRTSFDNGGGGSWGAVLPLAIDHEKLTADVTDFQLYVRLADMGDAFWNAVQDDGADIRVTGEDGSELAREVVSCDTATQTGELWVKVPAVSASVDTAVYVHFGNPSATDYAPTDPYGTHAVWGASANAVLHFEGNANDSSASVKNLTTVNGPALVQSKIGNGYALDGVNQYLALQSTNPMVPSDHGITLSAWVYRQNTLAARKWILTKAYGSSSGNRSGSIDVENLFPRMTIVDTSGANHQATSSVILPLNAWTHVCGTYDITTGDVRIYINGVLTGTGNNPMKDTTSGSSRFYVGTEYNTGTPVYFFGKISDVKVLQEPLSSALIAAEYANQSDPAAFYSVGSDDSVRMAELTGQASDAASRSAETSGQIVSATARAAETSGIDDASASRAADSWGEADASSERAAELAAEAPASSSRNAEQWGQDDASASRVAEATGQSSSAASSEAETFGESREGSSRDCQLHGVSTSSGSRGSELRGEAQDAASRASETRGEADGSADRDATLHGEADGTVARPAEMHGTADDDSSRWCEVSGSGPACRLRPVVLGSRADRVTLRTE